MAFSSGKGLRHDLFHRWPFAALPLAHDLRDRLRRANAGDDVLALRIDEELAVEKLLAQVAGSRVKATPVAPRLTAIAEHHGLHVDGGKPQASGSAVDPAIGLRARRLPGAEHRTDRAPELRVDLIGKRRAGFLLDAILELLRDCFQVVGIEFGVEIDAFVFLSSSSRISSNNACSTPSTTSEYIWIKRR